MSGCSSLSSSGDAGNNTILPQDELLIWEVISRQPSKVSIHELYFFSTELNRTDAEADVFGVDNSQECMARMLGIHDGLDMR